VLYAQAVGTPRDNGSVRSSALTPTERKAFAKIARDNGTTGDAVVDALTDAGIEPSQARSLAAEMRKRENGGVTALALALPNPAGPRSVPPDLSGIRSSHMAKFVGPHKRKSAHSVPRDNRTAKSYRKMRQLAVDMSIPQLASRLDRLEAEQQEAPLTLEQDMIAAAAQYYLNTGKKNKAKSFTPKGGKFAGQTVRNTRNVASEALANKEKTIKIRGEEYPLIMGLIPYASYISSTGRRGGGSTALPPIVLGPNTKSVVATALKAARMSASGRSAGKAAERTMALYEQLAAAGATEEQLSLIRAAAEAAATKASKFTTKRRKVADAVKDESGKVIKRAKYAPVKDENNKNVKVARDPAKVQAALDRRLALRKAAEDAIEGRSIDLRDLRAILRASGSPEGKELGKLSLAELDQRGRQNRSIRRRRNAYVMRKRHNAGGFDAKTIGFGIAGFAGGTLVGTLLNDLVTSKISKAEIPGINMPAIPTLVAAGLAADAFYSHTNRGFIFRRVQNIGLRYGLAAGLIFPMVARGLASKVLKFARLGAVDNFYGVAPAGLGSIYDTAFENVSGAGEYLAENGFGEYLAESGLGAVSVTAAPAGLGYFVQANGLGADVTAAPAGFGGVRVRAAVGGDEDTAGELDAAYLDGMGEISVQNMRQFAGESSDAEDFATESLSDGEEMDEEDLAIEGLGQIPGASIMRMTPESAQSASESRVAQVRILGRSKRIPGTLIVAITKTGYAQLDKVGGIPRKPSSIAIPPAPGGQANFRPAGIFAETVFGGRGYMG